MKVAFDVLPSGDKVNAVDEAAPSGLHVERVVHVEDDDGAIRVWGVRDGVVRLIGKAARRDAVIYTRVGEAPWQNVAKALKATIEGGQSDEPVDDVVEDDFITFDVDRAGVPSNLNNHREKELRSHQEGDVQVVIVRDQITVYGNGAILGRARKQRNALVPTEEGYLTWERIERGIATATPWKPKGTRSRAPEPTEQAKVPWTSRKKKWVAFVAVLYGFLVAGLVVGTVRDGAPIGWLAIELLVIAVAPLLLAWGIWILSSPEALSEPKKRASDGTEGNGPIASKGLALTTFGALVYVLPAISAGFIMFGPRNDSTAVAKGPAPVAPPTPVAPATPVTPVAPARPAPAKPAESLASVAKTQPDWTVARHALATHLVLDQVKLETPETSIPLALKDGARERGKRTCATGAIDDIERKDLDNHDVFAGTLTTSDGDGVKFIAVGSSGVLLRRSAATVCGVVIGTAERKVVMVGMFDLPENAQPAVER